MYQIVRKRWLNDEVVRMTILAPEIARKVRPGQFVILRIDERGERIPLTVSTANNQTGVISVVFQVVGATTRRMAALGQGQAIQDVVGPLGNPTDLSHVQHACVIGGGLGTAIAYPEAWTLHDRHAKVDVICGFRNERLVLMEKEMAEVADRLIIMTDDGSNGNKGFVTDALQDLIDSGERYDLVLAIGPVVMMKAVSELTRPYGIHTMVSMNTLMIDGTGMCGCCRVKVGNEYKHACVDGPDFDGHLVDFDEAQRRDMQFVRYEKIAVEHAAEAVRG
ncbi:MAG: sulfide/dihydroorotate dehydrogenase-like FAD/NAD-binding protein [Eggerthellaceae bacterium]|jgi:ferredoxin--NADP+ reductase